MGFAELPTTYTLRSWTVWWVIRLGCQALFFALLGRLTGAPGRLDYMLIGNSVAVVAMETMFVSTTAVTERFQGTFPLLVISPANMGLVYLGRGLHWPASGLASSFAVLFSLSLVFSSPWRWWQILATLPLLGLIAVSTYCYACLIAALSLRNVKFRTFYPETGALLLTAFCGVNVTTSFWPGPLHWFAQFLPLTHGLQAVRNLLNGRSFASVLLPACLEITCAALWAGLTLLLFERIVAAGRRDGSLAFS
ncbi:ABC-2 type transport system permease protein [Streptomyces sp. B3I7]|jgi:ABC-2 type transport system permease protein|uniref:ABC transporter permease n=1 Tax=unclassified Streptomyces TaxID=2593676 RepID=UPI002781B71A|nr:MULTISPECIES: ABC transporter permease [unclassified Streptomyces]MDQ0790773.1 ABC-2 type transport system permease protein [Streptomyces sp. B3I8]MDQ0809489.1 ABC-2 type transport system permease protein [Streptomyces sp. B3I7]